jgi:prophage regulatory protein
MPQVQAQVGLSKSQIYKLIEQGSFPKQIKVCQRVSAWLSGDIETWVEQRVLESTQEEQLELPLGRLIHPRVLPYPLQPVQPPQHPEQTLDAAGVLGCSLRDFLEKQGCNPTGINMNTLEDLAISQKLTQRFYKLKTQGTQTYYWDSVTGGEVQAMHLIECRNAAEKPKHRES